VAFLSPSTEFPGIIENGKINRPKITLRRPSFFGQSERDVIERGVNVMDDLTREQPKHRRGRPVDTKDNENQEHSMALVAEPGLQSLRRGLDESSRFAAKRVQLFARPL
jgi:hypothetical protein